MFEQKENYYIQVEIKYKSFKDSKVEVADGSGS